MNQQNVASAYRRSTLESAPPLKVVHLMYEGALRFLAHAERADPGSPDYHEHLRRADAVVSELRLALDSSQAPELAAQLTALYVFVEEQIHDALSRRDAAPLAEARAILEKLFLGWKELEVDLERGA